MGIYNRDYFRDGRSSYGDGSWGLDGLTPVVKYLILANQEGSNTNPYYVEPYHQLDLSVGYALNERWSFSFEAINLTGEDIRWSSRTTLMINKLIDQSPRYLIGAHYKF